MSLGGWVLVPVAWGWQPYLVVSGSMEPLLGKGDIVVAAPLERGTRIEKDDVVVVAPQTGTRPITHRVVRRNPDGTYLTKGDANPAPDTHAAARREIRAKARYVVPNVGWWPVGTRAAWSGTTTAPGSAFGTKTKFYAQAVIASGPVSYWRLGGTGSTGVDEMGTANLSTVSTVTGGTSPGAVKNDGNTARTFSAPAASYMTTASNVAALSISGPLSVTAWVRTQSLPATRARLVIKWDNSNLNYALAWSPDSLGMRFIMDTAAGRQEIVSPLASADNVWHQVVGTWDGTTMRLYLDGAPATSLAVSGTAKTVTNPVTVSAPTNSISADLDEVAVWSRALTATEVSQFYTLATT